MKKKLSIVIASDSFKGSASTFEVNDWIAEGILRFLPSVVIKKVPVADGGEGTVSAITKERKGRLKEVMVTGPLGEPVKAHYGLIEENVAILEMAEASGIMLVNENDLDPYKATTYGTGELILAALNEGVKEIYIGIGGSATNDGGLGMAQALGYEFKDSKGNQVGFGAQEIDKIQSISSENVDSRLKDTTIKILSDVTNPLLGENGASFVYGKQKGAQEKDFQILDRLLLKFADLIEETFKKDIRNEEGSGAAGGLGAGLLAFCSAKMTNGVEQILDLLNIDDVLSQADLVITGEGRIDAQSFYGKAPIGIASRSKRYDLPVIAIVGSVSGNIEAVYDHGIDLVLDTIDRPMSLQEAIDSVEESLKRTGEIAVRSFLLNN